MDHSLLGAIYQVGKRVERDWTAAPRFLFDWQEAPRACWDYDNPDDRERAIRAACNCEVDVAVGMALRRDSVAVVVAWKRPRAGGGGVPELGGPEPALHQYAVISA